MAIIQLILGSELAQIKYSRSYYFRIILVITMASGLYSCEPPEFPAPIITSINQTVAEPGSVIIIEGDFLQNVNAVSFGIILQSNFFIDKNNPKLMFVTVPESVALGDVEIKLLSIEGESNAVKLKVIAKSPTILSIQPLSALPLENIVIVGSNFTEDMTITLASSVISSYELISSSAISAVVPNDAKSGFITITNNDNKISSNNFFFEVIDGNNLKPFISEIMPQNAFVGDTVRIIGGNFLFEKITIFLSGKMLQENQEYLINNENQILINIPAGASSGTLTVGNSFGNSGIQFNLIENPIIESILPNRNGPGGPIIIKGKNLSYITELIFDENTKLVFPDFSTSVHENGEEYLSTRLPNFSDHGIKSIKFKLNNALYDPNINYEILPGFVNLPFGFSGVVIPNPGVGNNFYSINNQWLRNEEPYGRFFLNESQDYFGDVTSIIVDDIGNAIGIWNKDGSHVSIDISGIVYEGKFDNRYGKPGPLSIILTPIENGKQIEFVFPVAIDDIWPKVAKPAEMVTINGRYFLENEFDNDFSNSTHVQVGNNFKIFSYHEYDNPLGFKWISGTEIRFPLPNGIPGGTYEIKINIEDDVFGTSNSVELLVE